MEQQQQTMRKFFPHLKCLVESTFVSSDSRASMTVRFAFSLMATFPSSELSESKDRDRRFSNGLLFADSDFRKRDFTWPARAQMRNVRNPIGYCLVSVVGESVTLITKGND